jgi:hypothetical protein
MRTFYSHYVDSLRLQDDILIKSPLSVSDLKKDDSRIYIAKLFDSLKRGMSLIVVNLDSHISESIPRMQI